MGEWAVKGEGEQRGSGSRSSSPLAGVTGGAQTELSLHEEDRG